MLEQILMNSKLRTSIHVQHNVLSCSDKSFELSEELTATVLPFPLKINCWFIDCYPDMQTRCDSRLYYLSVPLKNYGKNDNSAGSSTISREKNQQQLLKRNCWLAPPCLGQTISFPPGTWQSEEEEEDLYIIGAVCNEKAPLSVFKRFCCFSCLQTHSVFKIFCHFSCVQTPHSKSVQKQ